MSWYFLIERVKKLEGNRGTFSDPSYSTRSCKQCSLENYPAFENVVFILTREIPESDRAKASKIITQYWNLKHTKIPPSIWTVTSKFQTSSSSMS